MEKIAELHSINIQPSNPRREAWVYIYMWHAYGNTNIHNLGKKFHLLEVDVGGRL
jgi:hypothetical protein